MLVRVRILELIVIAIASWRFYRTKKSVIKWIAVSQIFALAADISGLFTYLLAGTLTSNNKYVYIEYKCLSLLLANIPTLLIIYGVLKEERIGREPKAVVERAVAQGSVQEMD